MNYKKIIIGGIAGGIAYFFLGWLVYGILLANFMELEPKLAKKMDM